MKVVLDTNIWLSGIFWEGEAYKLINTLQDKKIEIIVTKKILLEIAEVLNKEVKFQKYIENRKIAIEDVLRTIMSISILIVSKSKLDVVDEHPSDNKILESAVDGKVDYLISYDNHLLRLEGYEGIKIMSPEEFLRVISKRK